MKRARHRLARRLAEDIVRAANRRTGEPVLFVRQDDRIRLDAMCEVLAEILSPLVASRDPVEPPSRELMAN